jgi:hypothetical protein
MKLLPFRRPAGPKAPARPPLTPEDATALRRKRWTIAILAVGFGAAIAIYFAASAPEENPLGDALQTKQYVHDLEVYGGKANVLAEQFREWFVGLWQGKDLAYTVAVLTILSVWIFRSFTRPVEEEDELESVEAPERPVSPRPVAVPRARDEEPPA